MAKSYENKNFLALQGRFVKDAEIIQRQDGKRFLSFSVAHSNPFFHNGEWKQETLYLDCQSYLPTLLEMAHRFKKGVTAIFYGQLKMTIYDSQKYGHKVKTFWLFCSGISLDDTAKTQAAPAVPGNETITQADLEQVFAPAESTDGVFRY